MHTMKLDEIKEIMLEVGKWGVWIALGVVAYAKLMQWVIGA